MPEKRENLSDQGFGRDPYLFESEVEDQRQLKKKKRKPVVGRVVV